MTQLVPEASATASALALPHHDGSELYVLERPEEPGGTATVRVRVPAAAGVERVVLRTVRDGEPRAVEAEPDGGDERETWWRASFAVTAETARYRWLLDRGEDGYAWLNGAGVSRADVSDADDFVLPLDPGGPDWHLESVGYQIYPDRFSRAGAAGLDDLPEWAVPRAWDALPEGRSKNTSREWFGGDLPGIEQRLDHVARLGANLLYLTPIFPAGSTHRYDATSFDAVDPLLGGDEALDSLLAAVHARGMRLVGDLTLNHCGVGHDWFRSARAYPSAPERGFFYWDDDAYSPHGYASWLGVPSLPKLNWADAELRRRMLDGVVRRWLRRGLDGWRIDVANMVARHGVFDANHWVARATRDAMEAERDELLLLAEHGHDFRPDLQGGGWHGAMNYAGFLRPVWSWLRRDDLPEELRKHFWALPVGLQLESGAGMVATMRALRSGVPWQSVAHSWTLLDSHDVARFRTVAGSRERQLVGVGLQMTSPGVPMVFAGDEIGLEGEWGEDARRTMPWDRIDTWDGPLFEEMRALVALRRSSDALARGGIRYVHVSDDAVAYLRESRSERLLCLAARAPHTPVVVPFAGLETLYGEDARDGVLPADGPAFHVWRISNG
ncbi:MAG TPA: glycoside hydrolase family 13 protein [Gaiellaceae bacterium]|nr:glycoside hydrolase family 13 protein [Gaiellaceae bacterium]